MKKKAGATNLKRRKREFVSFSKGRGKNVNDSSLSRIKRE